VTTNLSEQLKKIVDKNKVLILMTGTPHSPIVMKEIFGIPNYAIVEAEIKAPGVIDIVRTGKEFDCKYSNFSSGEKTRKDYLEAFSACVDKAPLPTLIHVGAFEDLPTMAEQAEYSVNNIMSREEIKETQFNDKSGQQVSLFRAKLKKRLFTTKCSRGVDFPGDICNSVIFTKYPNPNPNDIFWKVLKQNHGEHFWDFYKDKASRELLQRTYRALRSQDDHVYVLSPDLRVLEAIRDLQKRL
jgi:Rad3-related DNA helicase